MAIPREPDTTIHSFVRTFNDPAVHGRTDPSGSRFCIFVDESTGRVYPMVKTGETPTSWERVYAGAEDGAGGIVTSDIADLAVTAAKLAALAVTTAKLAVGVISADAAGRALFATDVLNAATVLVAIADGAFAADTATRALFADGIWTAAKLAAAIQVAIPGTATAVVAAQVGTARDVTLQLKDIAGTNLAAKRHVRVWLSDTAGAAPTTTAPNGGFAVQTGAQIAAITAGKVLDVVSDATGVVVVRLTESGTGPIVWFVNVAIGNTVISSAAVSLAN